MPPAQRWLEYCLHKGVGAYLFIDGEALGRAFEVIADYYGVSAEVAGGVSDYTIADDRVTINRF